MKKTPLIHFIIWFSFSFCVLQGGPEKFVIRIQEPSESLFFKYRSPGYDMSAYKPGEYMDLVVDQNLYNEIKNDGHVVTITQTESQLKQNLRGIRDLYGYRNYEETLTELQDIAEQYPEICQLVDLGDTWGKEYSDDGDNDYDNYHHESWGLKVSDNVEIEEDEPGTFFMGLHHSREPISVEVVMGILYHLLDNYGTDPEITGFIDNTQIWFIPIVNPNGHRIVTEEIDLWWRKNIRDNNQNGQFDTSNDYGYGTDGVDPNRNYGFQWGDVGTSDSYNSPVYHGPNAWSEPEIVAMKNLLESHHFVTGITYHSYSELVLFPFGYEMGVTAPDHDALEELAIEMAYTIPAQNGGFYTPQQSLELYPCMGTTDDYAYGVHSIFSFTIELGIQFIPPAGQIDEIVENNLEASKILLNRVNRQSITGLITNSETSDPVVAEVYVEGIDNIGNFKFPSMSDLNFGRYYRLLQEGNYDITFSAEGYETVNANVNITSNQQTILNISMNPVNLVTVTGQVTDGFSGQPINEGEVNILGEEIVYTDENGNFSLPPVYEGMYIIRSISDNYSTVEMPIEISVEDHNIEIEMYTYSTESFESSTFSDEWSTDGDSDWYFTTESVFDGMYSVRSGEIDDNQTSNLSLSLDVTAYGSIGFHYRVASEYSPSGNYFYDGLEFYINNEIMGQFQPTTEGETPWLYISYPVSPGEYTFTWSYVKDGGGGSTDMEEDCSWIDVVEFPPTNNNNPPVVTVSPEYLLGWNLVSLPVVLSDTEAGNLFPNWVDNTLYSFDGEYIQENSLEIGAGYWIRLVNEEPISFTGFENNEMQITVMEGWNMIGGLSSQIDINDGLIDNEEILLIPTLYGFIDGGYENTNMIDPGFGFWIRSLEAGEITLTNTPTAVNRQIPDISIQLKEANHIQINERSLYFGVEIPEEMEKWYSLPPLFSGIVKDVRFENESYFSEIGGKIFILNNSETQNISYNISTNENWRYSRPDHIESRILSGSGNFQVSGDISQIYLEKLQSIPEKFSVYPNFPNPFNNETSISFSIPNESFVSIKIYNIKGELIKTLMNEQKFPGLYSSKWKGMDNQSKQVSSGTYILDVSAGEYRNISKIVLLK